MWLTELISNVLEKFSSISRRNRRMFMDVEQRQLRADLIRLREVFAMLHEQLDNLQPQSEDSAAKHRFDLDDLFPKDRSPRAGPAIIAGMFPQVDWDSTPVIFIQALLTGITMMAVDNIIHRIFSAHAANQHAFMNSQPPTGWGTGRRADPYAMPGYASSVY